MSKSSLNKNGKRFGGPKKPKAPKTFKMMHEAKAQPPVDPRSDDLKIFLDDERQAPSGTLLIRNPKEFYETINALEAGKLRSLSLDWYLGYDVPNGEEVAQFIADDIITRPEIYSNLEDIRMHSSDIIKAGIMARTIDKAIDEAGHDAYVIVEPARS